MQILPNGKSQWIDSAGQPLASGSVGFYSPGTLNPLTTYQDQGGTIPNTNPVLLDSRGQAIVWGSGIFRQIVKDASGVTIWDQIVASADAAFSGSTGASLIGFDTFNLAQILTNNLNRVVPNISTLRSLSKALYTHAFVTGYYAQGDGGGGMYQYDSSDTTSADNNGTIIVASDGGRWKLIVSGVVSVRQFGAKGDYNTTTSTGTNDTLAFQNAVATGLNVYVPATASGYLLKDAVTLTKTNQRIYGDGRFKTSIFVDTTFNMSAVGVFVSSAICIEYVDLAILFTQPDSAVKSNMTQYPPAISGLNQPGQRILRCRISRAWNAVDWRDNCGQSTITDLIYSAFNFGIWLDGAIDSVRLNDLHCWPTDLTTNQTTVMTTGGMIGVNVGRCDDFKCTGGLFFCNTPFNFFSGTRTNAGAVFGSIENCDLDGFGGIVMSAGTMNVIGGFQSGSTLTTLKLNQSGGVLTYAGVNFQIGANFPATSFAAFMNLSGTGVCSVVGGSIYKPNDACFMNVPAGQFKMTGVNIVHQPNATFLIPLIQVGGTGQVTATDNVCSPLGTGAMPFFNALVDGNHRISQNTFFGHTINAPLGNGYYGGNFNSIGNTEIYNNLLTGDLRVVRLTASTDTSGNFAAAHGIANGNWKVLSVQALFKGPSGEAKPMVVASVDGTNVSCTGGTASQPCRVTILYSQATHAW